MFLKEWIDKNIIEIGKNLPALINTNSDSFACGYQMGRKSVLMDLDSLLEDEDILCVAKIVSNGRIY